MSTHSIGRELLNVPFADMVTSLGKAIASAQVALDNESISILKTMGDKKAAPVTLPYTVLTNGKLEDQDMTTSMIGAGFQPTFYQFAETIIEVKMAITITEETSFGWEAEDMKFSGSFSDGFNHYRINSVPVDATYSSKYNYTSEGSSMIRTRLVPVPPNSIIQQQLDLRAQFMQMDFEVQLKEYELALAAKQAEIDAKLAEIEKKAEKKANKATE